MRRRLEIAGLAVVVPAMLAALVLTVAPGLGFSPNDVADQGLAVQAEQASQPVEVPWPELSEADKARAQQIAFADPEVQELLQGKGYVIDEMWPLGAPSKDPDEYGARESPPREPFAEAFMNLRLDKVYQIEHAWPFPWDNVRRKASLPWPRQLNVTVRTMCIAVSLEEGRVIGFSPIPQSRPRSYAVSPGAYEIPKLTQGEKTLAQEVALADPRVQEIIQGKNYVVDQVGVWHEGPTKIGAVVDVELDAPYWIEYNWPVSGYDTDEQGQRYYREGTVYEALWVRTVSISVQFEDGRVTDIWPLPYANEKYVIGPPRSVAAS